MRHPSNPESPPAIFISPLAQTGGCAREGDAANRLRAALRVWPHDALWPRQRPRATRLALLPARPPTPATRRCGGPGGHPRAACGGRALRHSAYPARVSFPRGRCGASPPPEPRGAPDGIAPIYTRAFFHRRGWRHPGGGIPSRGRRPARWHRVYIPPNDETADSAREERRAWQEEG